MSDAGRRLQDLAITVSASDIAVGGSLGDRQSYVQASPQGWIDNLWSVRGHYLCGRVSVAALEADGSVRRPDRLTFHPSRITTSTVHAWGRSERTLLLDVTNGAHAVLHLELVNESGKACSVPVGLTADFTPNTRTRHTKKPSFAQAERRSSLKIDGGTHVTARHSDGQVAQTVLTVSLAWDEATISEPSRVHLRWSVELAPEATRELRVVLGDGRVASESLLALSQADLLDRVDASVAASTAATQVLTPDHRIDDANEWAKVNAVRVQHAYPRGVSFTNDPPQDVAVVRDMAWYVMGGAYISPDFTASMLNLTSHAATEPDGSLVEFLRCAVVGEDEPPADFVAATYLGTSRSSGVPFADFAGRSGLESKRDGYALTVKDDTPLFVLACAQQFRVDGDVAALRHRMPTIEGALHSLARHVADDGLVHSSSRAYAEPTNVWGLATWRNVINAYQILGAVTEINVLCAAAFRAGGELVDAAGGNGQLWTQRAEALKTAINSELWDEKRQTYVLTKDSTGQRAEVTGDLVFPLLFGVAPPDRVEPIAELLSSSRVQSTAGARTIPLGEPEYDPEFGFGLMGGVWPNLSAWIAVALRDVRPALVVDTLRRLAAPVLSTEPKAMGQVYPGGFPEWFSGDDRDGVVSLGMAASPWMPPTYTWCVVEGLLGISVGRSIRVRPAVPLDWDWWAVRQLPTPSGALGVMHHDGQWVATQPLAATEVTIAPDDLTDVVTSDGRHVALADDAHIYVLVTSRAGGRTTVTHGRESTTVTLTPGEGRFLVLPRRG